MEPYVMSLNIFGPIAIHTYGLCIAAGVVAALVLAYNNRSWQKYITQDMLITLINLSIIAGIVGGRALSIMVDYDQIDGWTDVFAFWDGGFSVLGSIFAIIMVIGIYAKIKKLSLLIILDFFGLYAPLVQAFGRLGCYFAGCCHGAPTSLPWGITYTDPLSLAPLCTPLHPTQLYNVVALVATFLVLNTLARRHPNHGTIFSLSLMSLALVRFITDFWRGDRGLLAPCGPVDISTHQAISILLILFAILVFVIARYRTRHKA
jgi:phosphatidylglycerol---prolipoprotein diacylglyceryl transferase